MKQEKEIKALITTEDAETEKFKHKVARMLSWIFSNLFSILFPVGAIFFVETFKANGQFNIKSNYSEMLMVAISICVNLIMQLNSKEYNIEENIITLIRIIAVGCLVISSLAYGVSKTIPIEELVIGIVFTFSIGIFIVTFILGAVCEAKKKGRG